MRLEFRVVFREDLPWCASVLEDGFECRAELRKQLPAIWTTLLAQDAMAMAVLQDHDQSGKLIAFGATVFVSERFANLSIATPQPHLALRLLDKESSGRGRAIMRPPEIKKQGRGAGLNLVILHYSEVVDGYSDQDCSLVREMMVHGLLDWHRRTHLQRLLYEIYGADDVQFLLDGGAVLLSDFGDWYAARKLALPDRQHRPYLVLMGREQASRRRGAWMSWLFSSEKGRLGLSPAEQRLVARAVAGDTDAQLIHNPEVSENTVRRHWRSIFRKFQVARIPLGPPPSEKRGSINVRTRSESNTGGQAFKKRPFLLTYFRQHPEELRPQAIGRNAK